MRRPGLWVANGHPGNTINDMYRWRPGSLTCFYDYLGANKVFDYKRDNPDAKIVVRFQHPMNWRDNPAESARNLANEIASKWPHLKALDPYVYFANEMNLHYENGDQKTGNQPAYETKEFYKQLANWITLTANIIKSKVPEMKLVCPPFAYGHHEDGAPDNEGKITEPFAGYDYLENAIVTLFDSTICGHYYWGDGRGRIASRLYDLDESSWHAFRWRRVLNMFKVRYGIDAKIIIDEAGAFNAGHPDFTEDVMYYSGECLRDSRVLALTYFLWLDPTNSPGNTPNSWVQKMAPDHLSRHIERLKVFQVDMPTPPPDEEPPTEPPAEEPESDWEISLETGPGLSLLVGDWPEGSGVVLELVPPHGPAQSRISGHKTEFGEGGFEFYTTGTGKYILSSAALSFVLTLTTQFTKATFKRVQEGINLDYRKYIEQFIDAEEPTLPDLEDNAEITQEETVPGDTYWRVAGIHHLTPEENRGNHAVYIEAVDENGKRVKPLWAGWTWEGKQVDERADPVPLDKGDNEPAGNITMHWGQRVSVWINGQTRDSANLSDIAFNFHTAHPDSQIPGNSIGHHSFLVVFQQTTASAEPPPDPEPIPDGGEAHAALMQVKELLGQAMDVIADYEAGQPVLTLAEIKDLIGLYESNNNYTAQNPNSSASGRYQYIDSTWAGFGGYEHAKDAPPEVQDRKMMLDLEARAKRYDGDVEQIIAHHYYPAWAGDKSKWNTSVPVKGGISLRIYVDGVLGKGKMSILQKMGNWLRRQ